MRPTGPQIAAGISLAGMTQEGLAGEAKIGRSTLYKIINGTAGYREDTIRKILTILEMRGVEFTGNQGVRMKSTGVDTYDGADAFDKFYEFLYDHLKTEGGDVCLSIYDETLPAKHRTNPELHRRRMKELVEGGDVTFRVIATKSDFNPHGYVQFKWLPKQPYTPTGFYAFGDCLALLSFVNPVSPYIVVIQSGPLTEAYRQSFNISWQHADEAPLSEKARP